MSIPTVKLSDREKHDLIDLQSIIYSSIVWGQDAYNYTIWFCSFDTASQY